jgi:signal peptidase I
MLRLLRVSGDSLLPEYREGDFVVVSKIPFLFHPVRPGDVVVFRHVTYGTMVKMVDQVLAGGDEISVLGTHLGSVDSRTFGPIRRRDVLGRVIWHIRRPAN